MELLIKFNLINNMPIFRSFDQISMYDIVNKIHKIILKIFTVFNKTINNHNKIKVKIKAKKYCHNKSYNKMSNKLHNR